MRFKLALDTNVLFSGLFFGKSAGKIIYWLLSNKHDLVCSEYVRDELLEVIRRKRLDSAPALKLFELSNAKMIPDSVYASKKAFGECEKAVRDIKDVPVLAFARHSLEHKLADFFVTGDTDLLEPKAKAFAKNKVLTVRECLEMDEKLNE